jgi:propanediol dehydratase small subunit
MGAHDARSDYPLGTKRPDLVRTPAGLPLSELTLTALREGKLRASDMRATSATLARQATIARAVGRPQLADNLDRASELPAVPDELILEVYTALRPGRSTEAELCAYAHRLEAEFGATRVAAFVREACAVYADRDLLARTERR